MIRWGRDPLPGPLNSHKVDVPPEVTDFTRADLVDIDVDGTGLNVAAHDVLWDNDHGWYCDITIDPALGYRQWVTLALARYQKDSVDGAHLGSIHQTEPMRLGLGRGVRLRSRPGGVSVAAVGRGIGNTMYARLEIEDPAIADADLKWVEYGGEYSMPAAQMFGYDRWKTVVPIPATRANLRIVLEEREAITINESGNSLVSERVVYVEAVELPTDWR